MARGIWICPPAAQRWAPTGTQCSGSAAATEGPAGGTRDPRLAPATPRHEQTPWQESCHRDFAPVAVSTTYENPLAALLPRRRPLVARGIWICPPATQGCAPPGTQRSGSAAATEGPAGGTRDPRLAPATPRHEQAPWQESCHRDFAPVAVSTTYENPLAALLPRRRPWVARGIWSCPPATQRWAPTGTQRSGSAAIARPLPRRGPLVARGIWICPPAMQRLSAQRPAALGAGG